MGIGRLRRDRHHVADRRRVAVRGRRRRRRMAGARRRRRQRQRLARRRPPRVRGDRHRLRARAARGRGAAGRSGGAAGPHAGRGRRGPAVRDRPVGRRALHLRRHVHAQPRAGGCRAAAGVPARRPDRPGQLDPRAASSASCSRSSAPTCRRPPACRRPSRGAPRLGWTSCSAQALGSRSTAAHFVFRYRSAEDFFDTFITYYGPTLRAWGALDDAGKESFQTQLVALANEHNRSTSGSLSVPSEYLEVVAHRATLSGHRDLMRPAPEEGGRTEEHSGEGHGGAPSRAARSRVLVGGLRFRRLIRARVGTIAQNLRTRWNARGCARASSRRSRTQMPGAHAAWEASPDRRVAARRHHGRSPRDMTHPHLAASTSPARRRMHEVRGAVYWDPAATGHRLVHRGQTRVRSGDVFHGEKGGLWGGMREAIKQWLPSSVAKIDFGGAAPAAPSEGLGKVCPADQRGGRGAGDDR